MTRRLRILKNCKELLFTKLKRQLATDKDIRNLQALHNRITAGEALQRKKEIEVLNSRYKENINSIINENESKRSRTITGHTIEIQFGN